MRLQAQLQREQAKADWDMLLLVLGLNQRNGAPK
jgi:hypothetical protein